MQVIGKQPNNEWNLGSGICVPSRGILVSELECNNVWMYCPIPIAFGPSGTCKTTALESALALLGANKSRNYSIVTREKIFHLCCESSGIPVGVDDPHSKTDIGKLLVELYNGKKVQQWEEENINPIVLL